MRQLNIVVVGTGMYVCGRGTQGYGTILPAICEWSKTKQTGKIYLAGRTKKGVLEAKFKIAKLQKEMNTALTIEYFPTSKDNKKAYLEAFRNISKPACAIVAVPDNLHKEIAEAAIKEGLHVLVVKPLAPTVREVSELVRIQQKSRLYCAVEFHKRYDYANLKLKDVIQQEIIGDPLYFVVEFSQRKSIPTKIFRGWVESTNIFQYLGIHYVDIIYFVTGAVPVRAMAMGQKRWLKSHGINTYDAIEAVIEWETASGKRFVSHILTNWIDPESTSAMSDQKIKVIGTKGRFESDQKNRGIKIVTDGGGIEEPNPYFCSGFGSAGSVSYKGYGIDSIHQFLNDVVSIESGRLSANDLEGKRPTFKDSLIPTVVLEAVNRSLKEGGSWIDTRKIHKNI